VSTRRDRPGVGREAEEGRKPFLKKADVNKRNSV
jgi:hypothetical protein